MADYTSRSASDVRGLLDTFGVYSPHVLIDLAGKDNTTEYHAFGTTSGRVHNVWLHAENGPDERYTLSVCSDHDDSHGCCDACGRWRNHPASEAWGMHTSSILAARIARQAEE